MVNATGANGVNNGTKPPDGDLKKTLFDFAHRQLSVEDRLAELVRLHGYVIKKDKLMKLNKKFGVPSVRRPPELAVATGLVATKVLEDVSRQHGPATIQRQIAREEGVLIPRDTVRAIQQRVDPEGAQLRFPGRKKVTKIRGQLNAVGIMEEVHCDGHEKLGSKALLMGPVGIGIYGFRDHVGKMLHLAAVPNDRDRDTVGHAYLDFIDGTGKMPVQLTYDGGTETGYMQRMQQEFRRILLPEISELERPSTVSLSSTDNIPIESGWAYWLKYAGHNIQTTMIQGKLHGWFAPGNEIHVHLFQWLWSQIVQKHLDLFKDYWNSTPRRSQKNKLLPTVAPDMLFNYPERYGLEKCGTGVPPELIPQMRNTYLTKSREDAMRFVPDEFNEIATVAHEIIGSPEFHYSTGWQTFNEMLDVIQNL